MTRSRLKLVVARHSLSVALNRPIPSAADVNAIKPRHLLRALLRQSSYLPDATARAYFHAYIVDRYRKYDPRPPKPSNGHLTPIRCQSLHKEARKGLLFLKRANDGHPVHLLRVLAMAYGRTGRKRHELLKTVMSSSSFKSDPSPMDEKALARLSESITESRHDSNTEKRRSAFEKPRSSDSPVLGPRLEALVVSQRQRRGPTIPNIASKLPDIPEKNKWRRPMPLSRIANIKRRWYTDIVAKVLPPLPESDWNMLGDLALGRAPWEGPLKRRTPVAQTQAKDPGREGNQPANIKEISPYLGASSVLGNNEIFKKENWKLLGSRPHTITPRFMRRLRGQIFEKCPVMKWNAEKRRWNVKWGNLQTAKEVSLGRPGLINMDMFKGVDEAGNVISSRHTQ